MLPQNHKIIRIWRFFVQNLFQKKLQAILSQKPDDNPQNGEVFDPDAYLRNVEQFDDVEVVIQGRNSVRVDKKQVWSPHARLANKINEEIRGKYKMLPMSQIKTLRFPPDQKQQVNACFEK